MDKNCICNRLNAFFNAELNLANNVPCIVGKITHNILEIQFLFYTFMRIVDEEKDYM